MRSLGAARRRLAAQRFLAVSVNVALATSAVLVLAGAINRWLLDRMPVDAPVAVSAAILALLLSLGIALVRRRSLAQVAAVIDRLGATRDRFLTALAFSTDGEADEMHVMAVEECARFIRGGKFSKLVRVRVPREAAYLLVPIIALAMLQWEARESFAARDASVATARAAVEDTAKKLEELARQTAKASDQAKSEELKKLAEQLQRSAEQLRANATEPDDAGKSALRELSALEQLVQEMQKAPAAATPEELKALAKALEQNEATKDAASALEGSDLAKAAEELEKAMQKLAEQKDDLTPEKVEKALQEALKRLAEQKQLSEAMQKLAQQMQRSKAGPGGKSGDGAKQLAQMLRQMPQGKSGQQSGGEQQNSQALQNLLAALQAMKFGEEKPGGQPQPQGQAGKGMVTMQSFSKDAAAQPGDGDPRLPSGQPGSEHDTGTTDSPFGKDRNDPAKEAQAKQLAGRLGDGPTLQESLTAAGDHSKSNRPYKELYEAMAPAAQDAVLQENIPLGSRFFIKRYFEAIRPRE